MTRPHYSLVTPPVSEPIGYTEAADQLRVDSEADAAFIQALISVAREYVESVTGRVAITSTWKVVAPSWTALITGDDRNDVHPSLLSGLIPIMRTPLVSVSSVKYYAPDAAELTTMSADDYRVVTSTEPGLVQITGDLPSVDDRPDAIQIEFIAGTAQAENVSPGLRHAMKFLVSHLYEERKPVAPTSLIEVPFTLQHLINNQRVKGWFA